jgi:hypothetical protein
MEWIIISAVTVLVGFIALVSGYARAKKADQLRADDWVKSEKAIQTLRNEAKQNRKDLVSYPGLNQKIVKSKK